MAMEFQLILNPERWKFQSKKNQAAAKPGNLPSFNPTFTFSIHPSKKMAFVQGWPPSLPWELVTETLSGDKMAHSGRMHQSWELLSRVHLCCLLQNAGELVSSLSVCERQLPGWSQRLSGKKTDWYFGIAIQWPPSHHTFQLPKGWILVISAQSRKHMSGTSLFLLLNTHLWYKDRVAGGQSETPANPWYSPWSTRNTGTCTCINYIIYIYLYYICKYSMYIWRKRNKTLYFQQLAFRIKTS